MLYLHPELTYTNTVHTRSHFDISIDDCTRQMGHSVVHVGTVRYTAVMHLLRLGAHIIIYYFIDIRNMF